MSEDLQQRLLFSWKDLKRTKPCAEGLKAPTPLQTRNVSETVSNKYHMKRFMWSMFDTSNRGIKWHQYISYHKKVCFTALLTYTVFCFLHNLLKVLFYAKKKYLDSIDTSWKRFNWNFLKTFLINLFKTFYRNLYKTFHVIHVLYLY